MKRNLKKKIFALAVIMIYPLLAAQIGTYTYYTVENTAHNIITTDGVGIRLEEWQDSSDGWKPYPNEPIKVMPGITVSKIVTLKNIERDAYLRMKYELIWVDPDGREMTFESEAPEKTVLLDINESAWTRRGEWWYYNGALSKDEVTEPFFTRVYFPPEYMGNEYQGARLKIKLTACAVQADNNGDNALEAAGWQTAA